MSKSASEVLTIYEGSSSINYSDTFEKDSVSESNAKEVIESYFYKFILRIQDSEIFSTRVAIYEIIIYAVSLQESYIKGMKILLEKDQTFKFYGKALENIFMTLKIDYQNKFDHTCNIDFLRNKIIYVTSEKIIVNKISILEEGHKE